VLKKRSPITISFGSHISGKQYSNLFTDEGQAVWY